jgi:hypothetical protein
VPDDYVTATGYLVIEADERGGRIRGAKLDRCTVRPPYLQGLEVAVKLTVRLPTSVFDAAVAKITVEVPEELISQPSITVEAVG